MHDTFWLAIQLPIIFRVWNWIISTTRCSSESKVGRGRFGKLQSSTLNSFIFFYVAAIRSHLVICSIKSYSSSPTQQRFKILANSSNM